MPHADPADPPRRRGNKARGHGTWDNDRPPIGGVVGRESGHVRLTVVEHTDGGDVEEGGAEGELADGDGQHR